MTFLDLFAGRWTVAGLALTLLPLVFATVAAFFAGYECGHNRGFKRACVLYEALLAKLTRA